jgi:hypothetical protein
MADDPTTIAPLGDDARVSLDEATPPPVTDGGTAETPPASSGEGSSPDPAPEADPPKADPPPETKSNRERLIAKLTGEEDDTPPTDDAPEEGKADLKSVETPVAPAKEGDTPKPDKTPEPAKDEELSELNHNAIEGFGLPQEVADRAHVVFLYHPKLNPRIILRYNATHDALAASGVSDEQVTARGGSDLARMLTAILFGDHASYYLAMLNGVRPSPVTAIQHLKRWLAEK